MGWFSNTAKEVVKVFELPEGTKYKISWRGNGNTYYSKTFPKLKDGFYTFKCEENGKTYSLNEAVQIQVKHV